MTNAMRRQAIPLLLGVLISTLPAAPTRASDRAQLTRDARHALETLYEKDDVAKMLGAKSTAILVFPKIVKAGFMFGGQMGDGVLFKNGAVAGYYNSIAGSYGLQIGLQVFGYALFFMNEGAVKYLDKSDGWEVGVGPSIVVVDKGAGKSMTSSTLTQDIYAYIFDQKGLMAGLGIQGSKITKLAD